MLFSRYCSNGDWDEFLNFLFQSEILVHHNKDHIKISHFTKFEVLSLDCNPVEGLYGFGGRHLRIRDICMEFRRPLKGHSIVTMQ